MAKEARTSTNADIIERMRNRGGAKAVSRYASSVTPTSTTPREQNKEPADLPPIHKSRARESMGACHRC